MMTSTFDMAEVQAVKFLPGLYAAEHQDDVFDKSERGYIM
jgi:hypothetical protein